MRVNYCDTILFLLISYASQRISASPLPLHNADMQSWNHSGSLMQKGAQNAQIYDKNCLDTIGDDGLDGPKHSGARSSPEVTAFNSEKYPYPTITRVSSTTKRRSRTTKSRSRIGPTIMPMTSIAPGTLFTTASYAQAPSSAHVMLSPVKPLYDIGKSRMEAVTPPPQTNPLPWVLGFLLPSLVFFLIWLAIRYHRRRKQQAPTPHTLPAGDSYSSEASTVVEKSDMEIQSGGPYDTSAMLALSPVSIHPLNIGLSMDRTPSTTQKVEQIKDHFELKAARFPTRGEFSSYIFPSTAAGVEREVRAARLSHSEPCMSSTTRNLMSTLSTGISTSARPLASQNKPIGQRPFLSRIQAPPRTRLSPKAMGDVLYSTGGSALETVYEEYPKSAAESVIQSPKAAYKGGNGWFTSGPRDDQALASGTSYAPSSPVGLRARRKSVSLIPEIIFSDASPSLEAAGYDTVAPLQITKSKPLDHSGPTTKSRLLGSTEWVDPHNVLGVVASATTTAEEEERKFAEFVRELVRSQDVHTARRRKHHRQASVCVSDQGSVSVSGVYAMPEPPFGTDGVAEEGPVLLPALSIGATLSDFAVSSSTLASESTREHNTLPLSFSRLSIGVAL